MRKSLLNLFLLFVFVLGTVCSQAQTSKKKVAYITNDREFDTSATDVRNDPIIKMLEADGNFEVTVLAVANDGQIDNLSSFDVAVVQESFYSTAAILKPTGSAGLTKLSIPFIYTKMWALKDGRALVSGGLNGGAEAAGVAITVEAANQSNELFNGIAFTDNKFDMFLSGSDGKGGEGEIALNYAHGLTLSKKNTLLGTCAEITQPDSTIFLNDFPVGSKIGSETLAARMIAIGSNFGAVIKNNGENFTQNGLTLWRNAVYSLAGLTVPTTPVEIKKEEPVSIKIDIGAGSNLSDASWNHLFLESNADNKVDLKYSNEESTGFKAFFHDTMVGINQGGATEVAEAVNMPATATSDNLYCNGTDPTGGITFENLNRGLKYTFEIFASRMGATDNRETKYTVTGGISGSASLNPSDNNSTLAVIADIVPDTEGKIIMSIEKGENHNNDAGYIYISAIRITTKEIPTGVNELGSQANKIKVFPIPFNDQLYLSDLPQNASVSIYSITGSKIYENVCKGSNINVNTSEFPLGIYILSVVGEGNAKETRKIIKK